MEPYHYWLIASIILVIVELFTAGFAVICFAIGALCSAIVALFDVSFTWQLVAFAIGTFLAFVLVRPFVLRYLTKKKDEIPMNADALLGKTAVVTEEINPTTHTGRVRVDGDDWKAVSQNGEILPLDSEVEIVQRDSIIVTVVAKTE